MYNQRKRDQGAATLQSLSRNNNLIASVYAPKQSLSNRILEVVGIALVLAGPYLLLLF